MKWRNKNYGKSPFDPDYRDDYDAEADKESFDDALEERAEMLRHEQ